MKIKTGENTTRMNLKQKTHHFIEQTLDLLYPVRLGLRDKTDLIISKLESILLDLLDSNIEQSKVKNKEVAHAFVKDLFILRQSLTKDIEAMYEGDPAAKSKNEIILSYPGFQAVASYRIAHYLLLKGILLLPRMITEYAHGETGIDIHPAAKIGAHLCIDHGTGVVIGETTIIGDHVKIYQGVTLGAISIPNRKDSPTQRHPTIGDHVVIYAQAIILGGDTVIGNHSVIGGNVWITESVLPHSRIYFNNSRTTTYQDNLTIQS